MFFFIAGVQPRTRIIDDAPRRCPRCGLHRAVTRRVDHYLSLFFVPLVPVKRGETFLFCEVCNAAVDHGAGPFGRSASAEQPPACRRCGRSLDPAFAYCPFCGERR